MMACQMVLVIIIYETPMSLNFIIELEL
jgi:hypothetical protein